MKVKHSVGNRGIYFVSDLRCQLWVIDQVLQRVAAAEFIQQTGKVADYRWRVRGVDETRDVPNLYQRDVPIGVGPVDWTDLHREIPQPCPCVFFNEWNTSRKDIDDDKAMLLVFLYHQAVATGLQSAETDAEQDHSGEGVVVDEAPTLGIRVVAVQG